MLWMNRYAHRDGTVTRRYWRRKEGTGNGAFLLLLAIVAFAMLHHNAASSASQPGTTPRPRSTAVYPVDSPAGRTVPNVRPEPSVSYPIPWDRKK
ncbi:hypothetical protein [Streptomyces sp. H39-S7]|uniref:hypothetical protein n=1 Tax=Streptomyces sp. H39-S7 TaxID=3004357 RepID=UPI0022AEEAA2|nr:hypothetical protein [Streptomyces sp. H39-S7]MCZ4121892.1 hypothetical protein [Streptomyces sp. H39-S7]